ncbi:MAG: TlpA disulfide reductase family protein [Planctomycetaceae bacterium]|nr:TlpA family protein disulfide reductase [Planctomycetaceae bacterium]
MRCDHGVSSFTFLLFLLAGSAISFPATALGQGTGFTLPTHESSWLNSPPISSEALRGKAAFLWFYEEGCPRCRDKWPELFALANKYQGEPIVFIAVNSGTPRASVQQYAREVRLNWPIIVDGNREFERLADVGELSLQNVMQVGYITGNGRFQRASYSEPEQAVRNALKGAAWKVPPDEIPASLRSAWLAIEFGNYAAAGPQVKRNLNSPKPDIRDAASKLNEAVLKLAEPLLDTARKALADQNHWQAYHAFQQVAATYAGFDLPEDVAENLKTLATNDRVKRELAALKALALIEKSLASNPNALKGNLVRLRKLIEAYPDTAAAEQAQTWLDRSSTN